MDMKKIGGFLKELRREKGLTQEQLAEVMGVSGRTVSRWETGANMPDLSILIQLAEYYDVEMKEILDGERKSEIMDKELKETLCKVADYSELEKEKAARAGNTAFGIMFVVCAAMIVLQLIVTGDLSATLGETAVLVAGGAVYIGIMVYQGSWTAGSLIKSTPLSDGLISVICAGIFSVVYGMFLRKSGADEAAAAQAGVIFFVVVAAAGFGVLRLLAFFNRKRDHRGQTAPDPEKQKESEPVPVFTADGSLQANMIVEAFRRNGIAAYKQDLGSAGFADVRFGMGRSGDDRVEIYVSQENLERALQVIEGMGL